MRLLVVAQHNETLCVLLRQPFLWSDDLVANHLRHCLKRQCRELSWFSPCEKTFLIYEWIQCFERNGGYNLLFFHPFLPFLWIRNLLYLLHTASQSQVKILCGQSGWLHVGLGRSAVEYESSAVCNDWLKSLCVVTSRGCRNTICTFLISRLSVVVVASVVGQLDGSCDDLCGPFLHGVDVGSVEGSIPFEMRSAGLDWNGTCLHIAEEVSSWMMATLLPTDVFHFVWWILCPCQYNGRICP